MSAEPIQQSSEPLSFAESLLREWIAAGIIPEIPPAPAIPLTQDEEDAKVREYIRAQRMEAFKSNCPAEFRAKIDRSLIPNLPAWDLADAWDGAHPGIWIWSHETGHAKTRMLWRQFGRLHVERGRSVLKITGQALAEEYFGYHMNGNPRAFYGWVLGYDVVMLDDLDKMDLDDKRAPRMCRELFDELYARHKPALVTANEPITHFQKRIGDSASRRMGEVCREIKF